MVRPATPSLTATKVARALVYLARDPEIGPLLPEGAAALSERLLSTAGLLPPWILDLYQRPAYRRVFDGLADMVAPGQAIRVGLRKRFIDDEVRAALEGGARQVLVLGAGWDTLAVRLAKEHPDRLFFEVDHPATCGAKRRALERIGLSRDNVVLLAADLARESLGGVVDRLPSWNADMPSVVVAEGVLMYLTQAAVAAVFTTMRRSTAVGSSFLFTWMTCDGQGRPDVGWLGTAMRLSFGVIGEPLRWCVPDESMLASFVAETGWRFDPDPPRFDLGRRFLSTAGLGHRDIGRPLERMAAARRG